MFQDFVMLVGVLTLFCGGFFLGGFLYGLTKNAVLAWVFTRRLYAMDDSLAVKHWWRIYRYAFWFDADSVLISGRGRVFYPGREPRR